MVVSSWKLEVGKGLGLVKTSYYLLTTINQKSPEDF